MNNYKRIELIRKKNIDLEKKLNDLTVQLKQEQKSHFDDNQSVKNLLDDLMDVQKDFNEIINSLTKKSDECDLLIESIVEMKKIMFRSSMRANISIVDKFKILKLFLRK